MDPVFDKLEDPIEVSADVGWPVGVCFEDGVGIVDPVQSRIGQWSLLIRPPYSGCVCVRVNSHTQKLQ